MKVLAYLLLIILGFFWLPVLLWTAWVKIAKWAWQSVLVQEQEYLRSEWEEIWGQQRHFYR